MRALLVAMLVASPAVMMLSIGTNTAHMSIILALLAAFLTVLEYNSRYPSIVEFRFAPPFNRIRFITLAFVVVTLSVIMRGEAFPSPSTIMLTRLADGLGSTMDFPYSPIRLMVLLLPPEADAGTVMQVRRAAGLAYAASLVMVLVFLTLVRFHRWPNRHFGFNVWVNLPLFDPTGGGDVIMRLNRDGSLNLVLGFLLPFIFPAIVKTSWSIFEPLNLSDPYTLIWTTAAWAFLPASLLMRGIAMCRIAAMVDDMRRRAFAEQDPGATQRV